MAQYIPNRCTSVANITTLPRLTLPAYEPAWIHCLCSASHTASPISDFCCALPPTAPEGPFSGCQGSYGHCLFISAFMLASKIICDDTYSNKSWCIVGQGMFALREINQMEREMCSYLEWQLNVDPSTLRDFQNRVQRDFAGPGPYPPTVLPQPVPAPFTHQSTGNVNSSMPAFAPRVPLPKEAPVIPSPSVPPYHSSPPDTPEASPHSASTSPASSVSPQTPPDAHGSGFVKVVSADSSPVEPPVIPHGHGSGPILVKPTKAVASVPPTSSAVALKKPKTVHRQFAYTMQAVW